MIPKHEPSPRVSIGLPVHNGENYLAEALDSILNQTFTDFELIISDNCSTDGTSAICQGYAARDARIRYERRSANLGAVGNFNYVFEVARGEYFKWAAHDDVCEPRFLEACVDILDANPAVAWCHTRSDMVDASGRTLLDRLPEDAPELARQADGSIWWDAPPRVDYDSPAPHRRFAGVLLGTNWCIDCFGLIRSSALRKTRLFEPYYGSEKVLMGALSLVGRYQQADPLLFAQRIHAEASSSLDSAAAQDAFTSTNNAKPLFSARLALVLAHARTVSHAELTWTEKLRCWGVVVRYLLQVRKWKRIAMMTLLGGGVGGGGKRTLERATQ